MEKRYLILVHGGEGSGRYPEGSGKRPFQHVDFEIQKKKFTSWNAGVNLAKTGANSMANIARANAENANRKTAKLLTDEELKELTDRQRLENNYVSALPESSVSIGLKKTGEILAVVGSVVGIAATVSGLFKDIVDIKAGKKTEDD